MKKINVTQPFLPPLEELNPYLEKIWANKWLTNNGEFHQQFEAELARFLDVPYVSLFTNGTLALVTALQALRITGEVITTPYSFVATAHSLLWNGIKPIFVDIQHDTLNLDPKKIEAAITPRTTAILPVHVYGQPCQTDEIERIADIYGLRVIYDAAHAFAVKSGGKSILLDGDLSILSFHATKVFNTFEGGAIVCKDEKLKRRIDYLKNFGFADEVTVVAPGINGKMSEFQSAMGLLQLKYIESCISKRKAIHEAYRDQLKNVPGIECLLNNQSSYDANYAYFPILVQEQFPLSRDELYTRFRDEEIIVRRYFYPLITDFPMYRELPSATSELLPCATEVSKKVLCLPIYPEMDMADLRRVVDILRV